MKITPLLVLFLFGCGAPETPAKSTPVEVESTDPCSDFQARAQSVWNVEKRTELDIPVKIVDGKIAAANAEQVVQQLDRFTVDWLLVYKTRCREIESGDQQSSDGDTILTCLDRCLLHQQTLIDALRSGQLNAVNSIDTLPDALQACYPEAYDATKTNPFE